MRLYGVVVQNSDEELEKAFRQIADKAYRWSEVEKHINQAWLTAIKDWNHNIQDQIQEQDISWLVVNGWFPKLFSVNEDSVRGRCFSVEVDRVLNGNEIVRCGGMVVVNLNLKASST